MFIEDIKIIVKDFCLENEISVILSFDMPFGYETAYGTYDVTINTLFLNMELLKNAPRYKVLFYLFHELRHALQYLRPSLFSEQIQHSRFYVVLYNGICFKLVDNKWLECILEDSEEYFTNIYLNIPYEIDANAFAYDKTKEICGDTLELKELCSFWMPAKKIKYDDCKTIFRRIDDKLIKQMNL
jgi:hypothetical protein